MSAEIVLILILLDNGLLEAPRIKFIEHLIKGLNPYSAG